MRKLIYIFGPANCGSTLLTTLLAQHPEIATVGELKATAIRDIEKYQCSCGRLLLECDFWRDVQLACRARGVTLDLHDFQTHLSAPGWLADRAIGACVRRLNLERLRRLALTLYPPAASALVRGVQRNRAVIDAICEVAGKSVFLDASKDPIRLLHFARSALFDVRAIHLVRDGRAIVASYKKRNPDMHHNLALWRSKAMECERVKALLATQRLLTVRYEDLCANVSRTLATVLCFADVPGQIRDGQNVPHDPVHIIGHNSRLSRNRSVAVSREWTTILSPQDLKDFAATGARLNALHGYAESLKEEPALKYAVAEGWN
jgi:hypothetical protein